MTPRAAGLILPLMKAGRIQSKRTQTGLTVTDPRRKVKQERAQAECDETLLEMLARSVSTDGSETRNRDGRIIDRNTGRFVK